MNKWRRMILLLFCLRWELFIYTHPPRRRGLRSAHSHILRICLFARSIAPPLRKKTSLALWIFCGMALQKSGMCCQSNCLSLRGSPYPVGDARDAEEVFIYTHPPPFKVCFPLRENRMPYRRHGIISLLSFFRAG